MAVDPTRMQAEQQAFVRQVQQANVLRNELPAAAGWAGTLVNDARIPAATPDNYYTTTTTAPQATPTTGLLNTYPAPTTGGIGHGGGFTGQLQRIPATTGYATTTAPPPNYPQQAYPVNTYCSANTHVFECRHEDRCVCGAVTRLEPLPEGL